ncbi:tetratricopeptide repeat protein [Christiangramia portivictoriae]|uniref:tetratricopeptide repeat protein n=1 Tax=Christiangramia portivictoriae TaxID=326069 RepID=UPI0004040719|nr:tetratricopeptide repeat protein [Christiangramia portivictoriae]
MRSSWSLFLMLCLMISVQAQEDERPFKDVNQDDLGLVNDEFQELFFEALKQKGIENYEKAIVALRKASEISEDNAVLYFELGKNYRELQQFPAAIENFQKATALEPKREAILVSLFETYASIQDFDNAISTVEKLIGFDTDYKEDLANLYLLNEDYENALQLIDQLDQDLGANSYRNSLRRQIYARTNNTDAQIENLRQSIAANPEQEKNYLNLIYMYSEQGEDEEAYKVANELLESNPGSSLAHLALYKFQLEKHEPEAAVASMEIVFESEEIDAESKFKVLNDFLIYVQENTEFEDRLVAVAEKLTQTENAPGLYEKLGQFYLQKADRENALRYFKLGIKKNAANFELIRNTLLLQVELQKFKEVRSLSSQALENFPSQPVLYLFQGVALNKLEKFEQAESILKDGLDYLVDDRRLEADFYAQLSLSYSGMNNAGLANEYRAKAEKLLKEIN